MEKLSSFTDSLTELMQEKGLTHISLGNIIGVANPTIHGWKTGKHSINLSNALKLADYFQCSLEFLMGRTEIRLNYITQKCPPFYERLLAVMKRFGKSQYRINKDTSFSYGSFSQCKKGSDPNIETLIILADYFDCTLDYLVGREK